MKKICFRLLAVFFTFYLSAQELKPVFRCFFENGQPMAFDASGKAVAPLEVQDAAILRNGGLEKDAFASDKGRLGYSGRLFPTDKGTIEVWVKPSEKGCTPQDHVFVCTDRWAVEGYPYLWLWETYIRFDVDPGPRLVYGRVANNFWQPGIWNHVVATYENSGKTALYVNGNLVEKRQVKPWKPGRPEKLWIGSNGQNGRYADAAIDSVLIYDRPMTPEEIQKRFKRVAMPMLSVSGNTHDVLSGTHTPVELNFRNIGSAAFRGNITVSRNNAPALTFEDRTIPAGENTILRIPPPFAPDADGRITLKSQWLEGPGGKLPRTAFTEFYSPKPLDAPMKKAPVWRLIRKVDPYSEEPAAHKGLTVPRVYGNFRYREAGVLMHNRFAYLFELPEKDLLLRVRFKIPDNRKRITLVSQTLPDFAPARTCGLEQQVLGSGILCGAEYPNTGKVLPYEYIFRHRSRNLGVIFESYAFAQPAAVGEISVEYAIADDRYGPAAQIPSSGAKNARRAGLYWEDPVLSMCFGGIGGTDYVEYDRQLKAAMDYFSWTGQNIMIYPTVWYAGPLYKSSREPGTWPSGMRHHPAEFPRLFALRCAERGIKFVPSFAMSRMPSLAPRFGTSDRIIAGEDFLNTVSADGVVSNTPRMERPPIYNALRPEVQKAVENIVEENIAMCGDLPSFGGISFFLNMWNPTQLGLWLDGSYDDWTMHEFAKSRNETLPGIPGKAERFRTRAKWIRENPERRKAFLLWRADLVTSFYERIAGRLRKVNPDAKLYLMLDVPSSTLYCTSGGMYLKQPYSENPFLEMGLDLKRLAANPGICLNRMFNLGILRAEEKYRPRETMVAPDIDLTEAFQKPLLGYAGAVNIHEQYLESHGQCTGEKAMKMPLPWKTEAPGRCCAPLPSGRYLLRYYARALEMFDPMEITSGGYTLGIHGAETLVREWTTAFRMLPRVKFTDSARSGDALVRRASAEGSDWYYLLNTGMKTLSGTLTATGSGMDPIAGGKISSGELELRPYELRVFRMEHGSRLNYKTTGEK